MNRARSIAVGVFGLALLSVPRIAHASCAAPANAIEAENCQPGVPQSTWDVSGVGDSTIQGFATDISVNHGGTIGFKVKTPATAWRLDIYRMGYYGGNGARLVATVNPSAALPQSQPACATDATGLIDCGTWALSASWTVPATAVSGIYFARAIRTDTQGASHILFIVRDDASHSAVLFQTSDATWHAYNDYGGNSFYTGNGATGRAFKVSYNRPFNTRVSETESWVFNAEYPMVRWLEANGYDVTYNTGVDSDRSGATLLNHKLVMSNGHDEYWSGAQRSNFEAARAAGVSLGFFSANTSFWKTRWENAYRTLVCYKETHANAVIDPQDPPTWTGTWRDPRFSPPADGGRPENALTGNLFRVNGPYTDAMTVPQADGRMRIWRNTSVAALGAGQIATLAPGSLGAEVNVDEDNGFRPPGLFGVSTNPISLSSNWLVDYGSTYGAGAGTHRVTLYKHSSGALVFSTGSYQWSWGLDASHDRTSLGSTTDARMQQATVNVFADMGIQPVTLQTGLTAAVASTDLTPPVSSITSPVAGASLQAGAAVTITGTAVDAGGGVVGGVEVSVDGGATWHPASGRESWSFVWAPAAVGSVTLKSRAVDDSGNLEAPGAGVSVTVVQAASASIWPGSVPLLADSGPDSSVELGVKFRSDVSASVSGIRFYKSAGNTGTHVASLWSIGGTRLASATFVGESASGWQQVDFASPVAIAANTVYVASYHCDAGHYPDDSNYFTSAGTDSPPLHALASGVSGPNGVYAYGSTATFPNLSWNDSNYWVDVVVRTAPPPSLTSIAVAPSTPTVAVGGTRQFTATGTYADGTTQVITGQVNWASSNTAAASISASGLATGSSAGTSTISATQGSVAGNTLLTVQATPLAVATASLPAGTLGVAYSATLTASGGAPPYSWSVSPALPPGLVLNASNGAIGGTPNTAGTYSLTAQVTDAAVATASKALSITISAAVNATLWPASAVPANPDQGPDGAVELGVKFKSDQPGSVKGIRFYKAGTNTGTHVANLWSSAGALLATATFTGETASGWQQVFFPTPVSITANTVYVASYHANVGHYAADANYFGVSGVDNPPLHALADGVSGGDGVYNYGSSSVFPNQSYFATNYWVDVAVSLQAPVTLSSMAVTPAAPAIAVGATQQFTATGTYSDGSTQNLTSQAVWGSSSASTATINASGLATASASGTTTISATVGAVFGNTTLTVQAVPLAITTAALPGGTQYQAYSTTLAVSGGKAPYTWSSTGLPAGLSLNASTGAITGTPGAAGSSTVTAQVTDANATATSRTFTLTISAAPPLAITSTSLPAGVTGSAYSATLAASGGLQPYAWTIPAGALPPGLTLNSGTGSISGTPTAVGAYSFTVTVKDSVPQSASTTLTITVSAPAFYSLWPSSRVPTTIDAGPDASVEIGVRFTADADGYIRGIRFYKSTTNTGTHIGSLWTAAGTKLASATFAGETASGWQQVTFASAVPITALATYVASYHATVGHYAADSGYFNAVYNNVPLHAPAGGNGVYSYGSGSVFPAQSYLNSNYWVDVVYTSTAPPPTLTSIAVTPASASVLLGSTQQFTATGTYSNGASSNLSASAGWTSSNATVASVNSSGLAFGLQGGTANIIASLAGVSGGAVLTVTPPPPPPNEGPGGPILIVSNSGNPFTRYLTEILRAEGLNEYLATDISLVSSATLAGYDLVLLGDMPLSASQASMFSTWVNGGGNLIALRPDKQLAGLLGLSDLATTLSNAYLLVGQTGAGAGIVGQTMQFHGTADAYATSGATVLATLYSSATASTPWPAVILKSAGSGQAAAFTYDLSRSIVFTRQGNPAWSGLERDAITPIRSDDLFFGAASYDPQPDWIDFSKIAIPQADEQQRLLANLVLTMNARKKPLPRFWYLPSGFRAAVVMTGDDHANGGTAGRFDNYIAASPAGCSVLDWQCIRGTSYIYSFSPLTNSQAASYISKGFEVALHPTTNCADFSSYADLDSYYASQLANFASSYPSAGAPTTNRLHCLVWSDYDTHPKVELAHGIRLDVNYYYWPGSWVQDRPGFFTGSGMPMRFADRAGSTIDVYQATTQMPDESQQTYPFTIDTLLDNAVGPNGYYGVFTANMHTDQVASAGSDAIVSSAKARGVPVVTSKQMLTWLDGRNSSSFGSFTWSAGTLSFTVATNSAARNLHAMLPMQNQGLALSALSLAGVPVSYTVESIKGISYAVFSAAAGSYQATYR